MTNRIFSILLVCVVGIFSRSLADDSQVQDRRAEKLHDLNGYFPFTPVENVQQWNERQSEIRRRILVSQGLWPMPTKSALNAVIHGRIERGDYVVDRVYFESAPGHFVTGSLYRPKNATGPMPAILSPHGHWKDGRFYDAGKAAVEKEIAASAESSSTDGRFPIQARAVQLTRMGCIVFVYDMTGNADSVQLAHRPSQWKHLDRRENWGFMSVQADLRLQNMMGLQTWNSIRAIDFLLELDETDPNRIGVTGASGGGTQTMLVAAIDDRIAAAMPCVMVSTAMQGGCSCENAPLLRIDQGNVDIAAAIAPRPLGLTAADDWTVEFETKGFPDLIRLYEMLGHPNRLTGAFHTQFKHNYNKVNREVMYSFFNRHFNLGFNEPIKERNYIPLTVAEATVWTDEHPKPTGNQVGDPHEIELLRHATVGTERQMNELASHPDQYRNVVGGAWKLILGRSFNAVGDVQFQQEKRSAVDEMIIRSGSIIHHRELERVPVVIYEPENDSTGIIVQVSDTGKSPVDDPQSDGRSVSLVNQGYTVITADLFGQGDAGPDGNPTKSQRMLNNDAVDGWNRFSGYTYGYNHTLFAQRVHDVLTLIKYARSNSDKVDIHGQGIIAGPIAAAAASQATDQVSNVVIDVKGFSFDSVDRHDHPMFVPGSVKYFGVDGLLSLIAPTKLTVIGQIR